MNTIKSNGSYTGNWQEALTPTPVMPIGTTIEVQRDPETREDACQVVDAREWHDWQRAAARAGGVIEWTEGDAETDTYVVVEGDER